MAALIQRRIEAGEWAPGSALPTTKELAGEYRVGKSTVFNAMDLLKVLGVVTAQQGGRRYVAAREDSEV